jgi:hypothetical protein
VTGGGNTHDFDHLNPICIEGRSAGFYLACGRVAFRPKPAVEPHPLSRHVGRLFRLEPFAACKLMFGSILALNLASLCRPEQGGTWRCVWTLAG